MKQEIHSTQNIENEGAGDSDRVNYVRMNAWRTTCIKRRHFTIKRKKEYGEKNVQSR